jgi:hypothetical protein
MVFQCTILAIANNSFLQAVMKLQTLARSLINADLKELHGNWESLALQYVTK